MKLVVFALSCGLFVAGPAVAQSLPAGVTLQLFRPTDQTIQVNTAEVADDGVVLSGLVRHGTTGVTVGEIKTAFGTIPPSKIPAGKSGFAVPMGRTIAWCFPEERPARRGQTAWFSDCYVSGRMITAGGDKAFYPTDLKTSIYAGMYSFPEVELKQLDFEPLKLEIAFVGWTRDALSLRARAGHLRAYETVGYFKIPKASDGSATFTALGGRYTMRPTANGRGAKLEVVDPPGVPKTIDLPAAN